MSDDTFAAYVKARRKSLDLTREELAGQVGCSTATIRNLENGSRRPSKPMAQRRAWLRRSEFADGVYLVPLAGVSEPALVSQTIVQALLPAASATAGSAGAVGGAPLEILRVALHGKHLLLVLDNVEQVLGAA